MFSGIIETTAKIESCVERVGVLECRLSRPKEFGDLTIGDSIAVDGVCLTLEKFDADTMTFALGPETLRVTGWDPRRLHGRIVNLERSLHFNDRIHGHLVTGHVDAVATVLGREQVGETLRLTIGIPAAFAPYLWSKGSVALNGVSLTVNACSKTEFQVGLIPETLKRTNLGDLNVGDTLNLEIDNLARGLVHAVNRMKELDA